MAIPTPADARRETVRRIVRQTLAERLAELLDTNVEAIGSLGGPPGRAPCLAAPWSRVGLSLSHEPGLSLAAVRLHGPVGIDLFRLGTALPDLERLSRDYLGPATAAMLAAQPDAERQTAFAKAWTTHEARLKCLGLALDEWSPTLARHLARCRTASLTAPENGHWVAALAIAD
ncbi:MAG TPA: 4'-phosphopantetheinyl transferase superfamily protein [Accumulibacter sp.]|nr:4'-phosphopantetheinyl transferase superfamily protein [Accumulibacter sp.]HQC80278.1 4'-phosphopantetheinyl transferase superfamily protein [Accumulibacter sp.]